MANRAFFRSSRIDQTVATALQVAGRAGTQPGWVEAAAASPGTLGLERTRNPLQLVFATNPSPHPDDAGRAQPHRAEHDATDYAQMGAPTRTAERGLPGVSSDAGRSCGDRSEQDLLQSLLQGDSSAWQAFERRYSGLIQCCIRRATVQFPAIGPEDAREIQAMLWVQLLANDRRRLRGFDPERGVALSTWIGMLAIHCAYDYLRILRREPVRVALSDAEQISSELPDPADLCSAREHAERLGAALAYFSARDREFVRLYFSEGLDAEQVAGKMGISVKTVYSKKHKIRLRLESAMAHRRLAA